MSVESHRFTLLDLFFGICVGVISTLTIKKKEIGIDLFYGLCLGFVLGFMLSFISTLTMKKKEVEDIVFSCMELEREKKKEKTKQEIY